MQYHIFMMLTSAKFNVEVLVSADFSSLAPAKHSSVELVELVGPRVDMQVDM